MEEIKSNAFIRCFDLEEINVDENNQNFLSDDGVLFSKNKDILVKCPTAKEGSYIIPDIVVEIAENAFIACNGLTEIKIPKSVTKIGDFAFLSCSGLTSIKLPDKLTKINSSLFFGCEGLKSVRIPEGVTEIESGAFDNCTGLINVIIPDSVTGIGIGAFGDCTSLKNISIGSGMKKIGSTVFYKCDNISDVYFNGSEAQWNSIEIGYNNNTLTNASIHYNSKMPEELMEESKAVIENSIDTASQNPIEKQNTNNGINMIIIILAVVALGGIIVTVIFLRKKNMK